MLFRSIHEGGAGVKYFFFTNLCSSHFVLCCLCLKPRVFLLSCLHLVLSCIVSLFFICHRKDLTDDLYIRSGRISKACIGVTCHVWAKDLDLLCAIRYSLLVKVIHDPFYQLPKARLIPYIPKAVEEHKPGDCASDMPGIIHIRQTCRGCYVLHLQPQEC